MSELDRSILSQGIDVGLVYAVRARMKARQELKNSAADAGSVAGDVTPQPQEEIGTDSGLSDEQGMTPPES